MMLTELKNFLQQYSFLRPTDIQKLLGVVELKHYRKGEVVIATGDSDRHIYFTVNGFFRTYVVRADGEERTVHLAGPGMGFGSSKTVYRNQPSNENVMALESGIVFRVHYESMHRICQDNPRLYRLYGLMLEKSFVEAIERLEFHSVMNPDQRYEYLLKNRPDLFSKVPLKYIASYIGITPVSMSRLRARMARPNQRTAPNS